MARHKAHGLDFARPGPGARDSRAGPERRALGVKRHAPRLAARQRGIFAFRRLTVVGPGRLLVAGEAARVRPGDEGCVLLRSQVPLPIPAYRPPHECALRRVDRDDVTYGEVWARVNGVLQIFFTTTKIGIRRTARLLDALVRVKSSAHRWPARSISRMSNTGQSGAVFPEHRATVFASRRSSLFRSLSLARMSSR